MKKALLLFGVLFLLWAIWYGRTAPVHDSTAAYSRKPATSQASKHSMLLTELCRRSQEAVLSQLKAPRTAKFPSCAWKAYEYETRATPDRDMFWVSSHVDAQNDFGALVRSRFVVKFKRTDADTLKVVQIVVE